MADQTVTIVLSDTDADRLQRLVESGSYVSASAAVSEALAMLEGEAAAPDLATWLDTVVASRIEDYKSNPAAGATLAEARAQLLDPAR